MNIFYRFIFAIMAAVCCSIPSVMVYHAWIVGAPMFDSIPNMIIGGSFVLAGFCAGSISAWISIAK